MAQAPDNPAMPAPQATTTRRTGQRQPATDLHSLPATDERVTAAIGARLSHLAVKLGWLADAGRDGRA